MGKITDRLKNLLHSLPVAKLPIGLVFYVGFACICTIKCNPWITFHSSCFKSSQVQEDQNIQFPLRFWFLLHGIETNRFNNVLWWESISCLSIGGIFQYTANIYKYDNCSNIFFFSFNEIKIFLHYILYWIFGDCLDVSYSENCHWNKKNRLKCYLIWKSVK